MRPTAGQLTCFQCGKALRPQSVDVQQLTARCLECGWVFGQAMSPFRAGASRGSHALEEEPKSRRPGIPRPPGVEVEEGEQLDLRLRTLVAVHGSHILRQTLIGPLLLLLGLAVFLFGGGVFGIVLAAVGGALTLPGLLGTFGHLRVGVRAGKLTAPTRWCLPITRIVANDVEQLYVQAEEVGRTTTYSLVAIVRRSGSSGPEAKLVLRHLRSPLTALFVEQEVERRLGIVDEPVIGEYAGPSSSALL